MIFESRSSVVKFRRFGLAEVPGALSKHKNNQQSFPGIVCLSLVDNSTMMLKHMELTKLQMSKAYALGLSMNVRVTGNKIIQVRYKNKLS